MIFKDQLNRAIRLSTSPKRIISLVPSQTELLIDLGLKERLVGITKFCVHPKNLKDDIAVVGGTKNVHYDKIEALQPDLIICNKEENTLEMVQVLEEIGPVWVSDITDIEESLDMIERLGDLLDVKDKALGLVAMITSEKNAFEQFVKTRSLKKVAYLIWKKPYMAAGKDTFIHSLLGLNRFENIVSETRYPEVSVEQLSMADLILLSTEPFPFKETDVSELKNIVNTEVQIVDGEYFSWYGSRLQNAFAYFKTLHE